MENQDQLPVKRAQQNDELALSHQSGLRPDDQLNLTHLTMNQLNFIGKAMAASGAFKDIKSQSAALVRILAGQEMGLGPFAAMSNISIIEGNASVGGHIMASRVKSSPKYDYKVIAWDREKCIIDFYELDPKTKEKIKIGTSDFTIQDAQAANLTGKFNWKAYPRNMLFNRAISNGVRTYCPDVLGNAPVYDPDELGAVTDDVGRITSMPDRAIPAIAQGPEVPFDQPATDVSEAPAPNTSKESGTTSDTPELSTTSEESSQDADPDDDVHEPTDEEMENAINSVFPGAEKLEVKQDAPTEPEVPVKPTNGQLRLLTQLFTRHNMPKGGKEREQVSINTINKNFPTTYQDFQDLIDAMEELPLPPKEK